nr:Gfo/Idh/MocA family oxidoreductase [uncultured Gemmiger sp.]
MKPVRMVLIGFGGMGRKYAAMLRDGEVDGLVLAGVCCRNAPGQQLLREEYPGVAVYQDVADTLAHAGEFDAALIVTPHTSHVEIARQMVAAGKHILLDKPAGVYARQVRALVEQAREAGVSFGMMFNTRANAAFAKARELLQIGAVGTPVRAVWVCNTWFRTPAYHKSAPWRSSWSGECGGLLINQSQHYLDIWQWLLGAPDAVYADLSFGRYAPITVDDAVDMQLYYDNGLHGTFISSTGEHPGVNRLEIWGERGCLCVEDTARITLDENEMTTAEFAASNREVYGTLAHHSREIPVEANPEVYQTVLRRFSDHLRLGTPMIADGEDGLRAVELTNAAYVSAWQQRRVRLPADPAVYEELLHKKMEEEQSGFLH